MLTEDTGTQGTGKFELELGFAQTRDGGTRALEFGPQLSYGVDYVYDPLVGDRRHLWGASAVADYWRNDVWRFTAEVGTSMNPDPLQASWLTVARFGTIATLVKGVDVDAGYQVRLARSAPVAIILAGVTIRW